MKHIIALFSSVALALAVSFSSYAAEPDKPGTKLITIQGGYGPGIGALASGNIALTNLGAAHLYGGLQLGFDFRHGKVMNTDKTDLTLAPRVMLGWNLGRVVEMHAGGFAGIAAQRFDEGRSQLVFSYAGFGGFRFHVSDSFALLLEGYYAYPTKYLLVPYGSAGFAFRF